MKLRTITRSAAAACFLLLALSILLIDASAQEGIDPLARVPRLLQLLNRDGFEVRSGEITHADPTQLVCGGLSVSGWYNNVGAPYLQVNLPPAPEETVTLAPEVYRLREDEAVLLVGWTPPPVVYFSYQTFLFGKWYENSKGPFSPYELVYSYLGDTVNSMTIQTTGPDPYNRPMVLIMTGHRKTEEHLRATLLAAGYPAAIINTETLTPSLVRFGYAEKADGLTFLNRVARALPGSEQAVQDYIDAPPLAVFRVRPKLAFTPDPLPAPTLRTRGTGRTEMDLYPTLQKLRKAVLDRYGADFQASELDTDLPWPEGYPAIQRQLGLIPGVQDGSVGVGRDANYLATPWFDLPEDGFAMVYGVNHAASGKATYSSLTVYLDPMRALGVTTAQSQQFPGTADLYLPGEPAVDQFYVWKVTRDCHGEPDCIEAKSPCEQQISPDAKVRIAFRAYAEPSTKVGPYDVELLYDRVIVFKKK